MKTVGVIASSFLKSPRLIGELKSALSRFPHVLKLASEPLDTPVALGKFSSDCHILLIGREKFDRNVISKLPLAEALVKYGVGKDNIDEIALLDHGIDLYWESGVNAHYVAEYTVGMILALMRRIAYSSHMMRHGEWVKNGGVSLRGQRLAIVGCGHIGTSLIPLMQPFGLDICLVDVLDKSEVCKDFGVSQVDFSEALREADVVSLHVPLTHKTSPLIDEGALSLMKDSAYLINTCRGEVWDIQLVIRALEEGKLGGAACDVFKVEPYYDSTLAEIPNFLTTPHIAGNSSESIQAMGQAAIRGVVAHLSKV